MKAAILYKANTPLEVVDVEQQGPQAGEARVRVMATGVCHSDWHVINGDWTLPLPMVLGHEAAGIVEEVGPGVSTVRRGDHIIFSFPRSAAAASTVRAGARSSATATPPRASSCSTARTV